MRYQISELIDLVRLQRLMESLYRATGIKHARVDDESRMLTAVGWEPFCTNFHRAHLGTCEQCLECDRYILDHLHEGPYVSYACPNGLVDYATPVVIDGKHGDSIFTCQVFHQPPDLDFYRRQAAELGFDEDDYVAAVRQVPIIPRERMPDIMAFQVDLAHMLAQHGLTQLHQLEATTDLHRVNGDLVARIEERTAQASAQNRVLAEKIALQERVEAALRQEKRFAEDLVSSLPGIFYVLDEHAQFARWNDRFPEVTGYSNEEFAHLSALDLFSGADRAAVQEGIRKVFRTGNVAVEAALVTKGGRKLPHYFTGRRTFIDGKPYLVGVGVDTSEQQAAETRRRESEDKLRGLYELSPLGIVLTDEAGRFVEFNEAFRQITGYPEDELKRLRPRGLTPLKFLADERRAHATLASTGRYGPYEKEYRRADGSRVPVRLNGMAVTGSDGQRYTWSIVEDITFLKEHQNEINRMAHYDVLTGVPNRALLADRLSQAIAQARRNGSLIAVCYLDMDEFKQVNERYGHDVGDQLLVDIAGRLTACLRGGDTIARIGGDEFVLLLSLDRLEECDAALERLLEAVRAPFAIGEHTLLATACVGATVFPFDEVDGDALIRHADQAMYNAKQAGQDRYNLFDPEQDRRTRTQLEQVASVGMALCNQEFVLYYQPKVNMRLGTVIGAEALIRWQHPLHGLLSPGSFLPAVETTDQIVAIGDWCIATVLRQLVAWQRAGLKMSVSVNVAGRHLLREDFVPRLRKHLEAYPDLPRGCLELEVLETTALEDIEHVANVIRACRELGVCFSLDDFGTGYSSLTYLKQLPVETLKIDQTFVRDVLSDPEDIAIIEGIVSLCDVFHRRVIAEGVETVDHGILLLTLGCELAQGFGIAKPMPAAELLPWVRSWRPDPRWVQGYL